MPVNKKKITKDSLVKYLLAAARSGQLFDLNHAVERNDFYSSLDRFSEIAFRLHGKQKVLDVGSGTGILCGILALLGHEVHALDFFDRSNYHVYRTHSVLFSVCNIEADPIPYPNDFFDAVVCCQTLEHFTHAHLPSVLEMKRVLKPGGILEIDVPNAVCLRNRIRVIRGKHITWDYEKHYLDVKPSVYKGREYYPDRHNRELTFHELKILFNRAGFSLIEVRYLRNERFRSGFAKLISIGSFLRNIIPSTRKSLIGFGVK